MVLKLRLAMMTGIIKKSVFQLLAEVTLAVLLCAVINAQQPKVSRDADSQAADFIVRDLDEAAIKSLIGRGGGRTRPLMLYLWYTACEPCRARLSDVERIYDEYQTRGLDVAIISISPIDHKETLSKYLMENKVRVPAYLLQRLDDELAEDIFKPDWEVIVPSAFFYDVKGHLVSSETELAGISYASLKTDANKLLTSPHQ